MSAIVAGKACKKCGDEFWCSFGHPKWFNEGIRGKSSPEFEEFKALAKSGVCPDCYADGGLKDMTEDVE